jgi:hypothetical protein
MDGPFFLAGRITPGSQVLSDNLRLESSMACQFGVAKQLTAALSVHFAMR